MKSPETLEELKLKLEVIQKRLKDELGCVNLGITLDPDFKSRIKSEEDQVKLYKTVIEMFEALLNGELTDFDINEQEERL